MEICGKAQFPHSIRKLYLSAKFPHQDMRKLCLSANFHTKKLGEIMVFYAARTMYNICWKSIIKAPELLTLLRYFHWLWAGKCRLRNNYFIDVRKVLDIKPKRDNLLQINDIYLNIWQTYFKQIWNRICIFLSASPTIIGRLRDTKNSSWKTELKNWVKKQS